MDGSRLRCGPVRFLASTSGVAGRRERRSAAARFGRPTGTGRGPAENRSSWARAGA